MFLLSIIEKEELLNFATVAMEKTWQFRIKLRWKGNDETWEELSSNINRLAKEYWDANMRKRLERVPWQQTQTWKAPPNWIKVNFDVVFHNNELVAAVLFRNDKCEILKGWTRKDVAIDVFTTEAIATFHALLLAKELKAEGVIFEGDSLNVINSLKGHSITEESTGKSVIDAAKQILHCWLTLENYKHF
jgi:hypothetical protein